MVKLVFITVILVWGVFAVQAKTAVGTDPEVSVYPNPFTSEIVINVSDLEEPVSVEVTDLLGKTLYKKSIGSIHQWTIPVQADWAKGIYIVNVKTDHYQISKKLVRK